MLSGSVLLAENWPHWRGADMRGLSQERDAPSRWSKTENVKWRVPLAGPGNSTPVVWGDSIFITQPVKQENLRKLQCFDRKTGKLLWERSVKWDAEDPTHATNPHASASPATDGERVVAWFGSAGLHAFDMKGKDLWKLDLGLQRHTWGYASSPLIHGNLVILHFGPGDRNFLAAFDKRTGKTIWRNEIPTGAGMKYANWDPKDMYGSWSTPVIIEGQLIISHPQRVTAYDPASGKTLWSTEGMGDLVYSSPIHGNGVIVALGGFGGPSMGLTVKGGKLWRQEKSKQYIGSGIVVGDNFYTVDNGGIAYCMKLRTGETIWTQRLKGDGDDNGVWSSPVLNNGRIYVMNKSAQTFIFQAKPEFELLGSNALGEPSNSSVVISGGDIFLRTHEALWAIGGK